jgi:hypothetical protein
MRALPTITSIEVAPTARAGFAAGCYFAGDIHQACDINIARDPPWQRGRRRRHVLSATDLHCGQADAPVYRSESGERAGSNVASSSKFG